MMLCCKINMIFLSYIMLIISSTYCFYAFKTTVTCINNRNNKIYSIDANKFVLHSSSLPSTLSSSINLIRKSKVKDVAELMNEITSNSNEHMITKFLSNGERPFGITDPINFYDSSYTKEGTIVVTPEYNKKSKTGFIIGMPPPEIMGGVLREAGSKAVIVSLDKRRGGSTYEEFQRFTLEQARARIFTPGPISVIWNDYIIDKIQIAHAATLGAAAVTLLPELSIDNNVLEEHILYCKELKVEPIVFVKDINECNLAISYGARVLCMHTLNLAEMKSLRDQLPNDKGILYGAKLLPEIDFSMYAEIDLAWELRDSQFKFVWPSPEAVFTTGMGDLYGVIFAMRSKASRFFLSPRQFLMDRKKEGATEYLGDILY